MAKATGKYSKSNCAKHRSIFKTDAWQQVQENLMHLNDQQKSQNDEGKAQKDAELKKK